MNHTSTPTRLSCRRSLLCFCLLLITIAQAGAESKLILPSQRQGIAIAVLEPNRIYLLDGMRNELVWLDTTGQELRCTGGFGSAPGLLQDPTALIASGGDLYLLDSGLARVQRYNRGLGLIWTVELEPALTGRFGTLTHSRLAMLANGQLLTGDIVNRIVTLYTADASQATPIIYPGHTAFSLIDLSGLVCTEDRVHVYDAASRLLYSCDIWGEPLLQQRIPEVQFQVVTTDGERLLLAGEGQVLELYTGGTEATWHSAPWLPAEITDAASVAGFLFLLDGRNNRILWERF